jgi:DNA (cytosine-5)-methyltransferase 1
MNVLDLFSGIGGFSLGLERAGMRTVAFCEIDDYCRAVLRKHWPSVPCYQDIRELTAGRLARDGIFVDVICGGFPCQDISAAGKGAGITGERSGLWFEYARLIGEIRPRFVIVENVAALLARGLGEVLGELAAIGYDAEWHCIPASAVGAPHRRDRIWIVAYPNRDELWDKQRRRGRSNRSYTAEFADNGATESLANPSGTGARRRRSRPAPKSLHGRAPVSDTNAHHQYGRGSDVQMGWGRIAREIAKHGDYSGNEWSIEPDVGRVAHGIPARVDRLGALGNAVVPQIPEIIGRAIMSTAFS